jgi:two-component system, LuxR family, response regulator FixJ
MPEAGVIYVIDDDDAVRHSICMLLDSYGIAARLYTSGASFLADLPLEHGCLLIDVNMPGMNGLELLDWLRARGIAIPVIVMTGAPTRSVRLAVDRAGATLLRKPFRTGELIACIEKVFGRSRAEDK